MSAFEDMLLADAQAMGEFREAATYQKKDGSAPRSINVIPSREGLRTMPGEAKAGFQGIRVAVDNSASSGIAASELVRGDRLAVADYPGGPAVSRMLNIDTKRIDAGMLILELI